MQIAERPIGRRVVLVHWKNKASGSFEVYSNLKNFCAHYPEYSYNTLNNYLSKLKVPFENETVLVERKNVINNAAMPRLIPVVRKAMLKDIDEQKEDVAYWLSRPPAERVAAVTFMISQMLEKRRRNG